MIMWTKLCFYRYARLMEVWILHLPTGNQFSGEKPLDSYELWKCEHYGSGDKTGFNSSHKHCCMGEGFFTTVKFSNLLIKQLQLLRSTPLHCFYALQLAVSHKTFIGLSNRVHFLEHCRQNLVANFKHIFSSFFLTILCLC